MLQRHAGNQAVTAMLERSRSGALQRKEPGATPQEAPPDAKDHPDWPAFRAALGRTSLPPSEIEWVWATALRSSKEEPKERARTFSDVAERLRDLLSIAPGRPMGLWSGGIEVSEYAQQRGFSTLEHTQAGSVFESIALFKNWDNFGELWNHLSRVFVGAAQGEIHVFMRTHDPMSSLLTTELPQLEARLKAGGLKIRWHALFGEELGDIREIDAALTLADDATFDSLVTARSALKRYLSILVRDNSVRNTAAGAMKVY
jgi:hypothetical protein